MSIDPRLHRIVAAQPYPLLFATISGAHIYGFPSPDSDFDLRGAHVLPLEKVVGLAVCDETVEQSLIVPPDTEAQGRARHSVRAEPDDQTDGAQGTDAPYHNGPLEMDIVSHDVRKFFGLLLKKNGYVLEQLFSPLIEHLMSRLQAVAAVASDVGHLMGALPPLVDILRYGNVRKTDADMVADVVSGLVTRICIGLPGACGSLNDEAAEEMFRKIIETHAAIGLLQNTEHTTTWNAVLRQLADSPNLHGLIAGRACRLLHESQQLDTIEAARRFGLALSIANAPTQAAGWVDGFLRNSGLLLLHDEHLWQVLDEWVSALTTDHFTTALPLLRRTFSTFQPAERRQIGARVAGGAKQSTVVPIGPDEFDEERANKAMPILAQLLGLRMEVKR